LAQLVEPPSTTRAVPGSNPGMGQLAVAKAKSCLRLTRVVSEKVWYTGGLLEDSFGKISFPYGGGCPSDSSGDSYSGEGPCRPNVLTSLFGGPFVCLPTYHYVAFLPCLKPDYNSVDVAKMMTRISRTLCAFF